MREVGTPQVCVAEGDQPRHLAPRRGAPHSANPVDAPSGRGGNGEGPETDFR